MRRRIKYILPNHQTREAVLSSIKPKWFLPIGRKFTLNRRTTHGPTLSLQMLALSLLEDRTHQGHVPRHKCTVETQGTGLTLSQNTARTQRH